MSRKCIHVTLNPIKDEDIIEFLKDKSTTDIVKSLIRYGIENNIQFKTVAIIEQ